MADEWFIKRDDKKTGPYSSTQLVEMAKKGQVLPIDWVAKGEDEKWRPASQMKGLFAAPEAVAPPPLPAAIAPPMPTSIPLSPLVAAEVAEWYCTQKGQRTGPVTWSQLRQLATSGELASTDMVWKNGMPTWVPASSIQNLLPLPHAVSSPPPSLPSPLATGSTPVDNPSIISQPQARELAQPLVYPAIAMLIVSGLALLFAGLAIVLTAKGDFDGRPAVVALFFLNTVAAIFATLRMTMLKEWHVGLAASILIMTDWIWLFFTGAVGPAMFGVMAGISVGVWCMLLLFKPGMRSCFGRTPPLPPLWEKIRVYMQKQQVEATQAYEDRKRRKLLIGKWESVEKGGIGLQFTEDGALIRTNGKVDKFTFSQNTVQIDHIGGQGTNAEKVISLSEEELAMTMDGQVKRFRREYSPEKDKRLRHLIGKWEPVDGNGSAVQFTEDRAIIREDGLIARYRNPDADTIEVYADDASTTLRLKVISLSEHELALTADGQGKHYIRSRTFTEEVERKQTEAANEALRGMGKTAAKVAGGAVLAVGALAFLGLAAAAASSPVYCHCGHIRPCPWHG